MSHSFGKCPPGIWDRTVSVSPQISAEVAKSSAKKRGMADWSLASKRWTRPSPAKRFGTTVTRREALVAGSRRLVAAFGGTFLTPRLLTVSSGEFSNILTWFGTLRAMALPASLWNPISMSMLPEPWLRGPITGVHPLVAPVLYAFEQAREDLARATADLTVEEIWASPHGFGSVGFHIAHIAGSTERLMSYLAGRALTEAQWAAVRAEPALSGIARDPLLRMLDRALGKAGKVVSGPRPGGSRRAAGSGPRAPAHHRHRASHAHRGAHPAPHRTGHRRGEVDGGATA